MTHPHAPRRTDAVFFDVDFTLIYPGPAFQGVGYRGFCAKHGIAVDEAALRRRRSGGAGRLEDAGAPLRGRDLHPLYAADHRGDGRARRRQVLDACAAEIYVEWARCHHFHLYDDVADVMRQLSDSGIKVGLISNSHRSLEEFQTHFRLGAVVSAAVSSAEHGYMKPHPSIFQRPCSAPACARMRR